jgi:hypothetical protein
MDSSTVIRVKDRNAVVQALRAGVVPRFGQHLIQVGRHKEIQTLLSDIDMLTDGGATFRLVIGDYGSGKTFFMNLIKLIALEKKIVVASADMNPDRRLQSSGGQARSLYTELMRNISTRAKPDGGALNGIVEKFITSAKKEASESEYSTEEVIERKLSELKEMVNGYDFATVISAYYRGFKTGDDQLKSDAIRWLRGEFTTKMDARHALGVRTNIADDMVYDQLKLLS